MDREKVAAIEALVCGLQGVLSSRAVLDDQGQIVELHVLADESRAPKQVVRDIETVLLLRLNHNIDHKKISVVQIAGGLDEDVNRINLGGISYRLDKATAEVSVSLSLKDTAAEVAATGPNSQQNQTRLVAAATAGADFAEN